jgi:group I intron endonuclease
MYQVYQIVNNINNRYYIGLHKGDIYIDKYYGSGKLIRKAVEKHGRDNFSRQVIATFDDKKLAKWFERCIVGDSLVNDRMCYNLVVGSGGYVAGTDHPYFGTKRIFTEDHRKNLSIANKGERHPHFGKKRPNHSSRMSGENNPMKRPEVSKKLSGEGNGMYGVPSPMKGKKRPEHSKLLSKEVLKLDFNGNVLKVYPSITIAAKENNISTASISYCCSGRTKNACGFIWKLKTNKL